MVGMRTGNLRIFIRRGGYGSRMPAGRGGKGVAKQSGDVSREGDDGDGRTWWAAAAGRSRRVCEAVRQSVDLKDEEAA